MLINRSKLRAQNNKYEYRYYKLQIPFFIFKDIFTCIWLLLLTFGETFGLADGEWVAPF